MPVPPVASVPCASPFPVVVPAALPPLALVPVPPVVLVVPPVVPVVPPVVVVVPHGTVNVCSVVLVMVCPGVVTVTVSYGR